MSEPGYEELLNAIEQRLREARLHYREGDRARLVHALSNASMLLNLLLDQVGAEGADPEP
jgi:hypothetical protein